ncbi:acyltransferase family protein [Lacimicrobium alkaliphilum]|uniref:Membrane protein n=1 Tax=Lacimicrobium alkaliphilum TaxID=1526571 RepID=A0ABQ1QZE5_9ALTE|nr:heparan-alpha-glucosaminide N-acetyltransferase domain-containing protein [Lacimicrobium alkaliphilum]GGD52804.1 membrane protein [Lacimicrobium alkaliphilum]
MQRELSLDIFRGLTLAAMILVNTPGSWSSVYWPLLHAKWSGLTPTDLVFPFFLFIVGAAMFHSMSRLQKGEIPWLKIIKRTALLFLIGLMLNIYPFNESAENWRIMGVLQRIALCYFLAAILILTIANKKGLWICSGLMLLGYFALMLTEASPWALESNLARQVDLYLLGASHLYKGFGVAFDPEGLLSTLPATVTVIIGYLTSAMLAECHSSSDKIKRLLGYGVLALLAGVIWHQWMPINKPLWTSSYVLVTAGFAWLLLALIVFAHDMRGWHKSLEWAQIYGSNPLFIYVLSSLFATTMGQVLIFDVEGDNGEKVISAHRLGYEFLNQFLSAHNASLVFALLVVGMFYLLSLWLFKRKIFIKL